MHEKTSGKVKPNEFKFWKRERAICNLHSFYNLTLVLHENALVFSLSEARNFFMYIIRYDLTRVISKSMNSAQNCSIDLFSIWNGSSHWVDRGHEPWRMFHYSWFITATTFPQIRICLFINTLEILSRCFVYFLRSLKILCSQVCFSGLRLFNNLN